MFFDPAYLLMVMLPSLVLSLAAQSFVRSAFNKWSNTRNTLGVTGVAAAERIKSAANMSSVRLEGVPGQMSDHFDPASNTVRISQDVATRPSVAALAIVAHELGHAQQYQEKSLLITMRGFLVPAMQFSPMVSYGLILAGFLLHATGLLWAGILFFGVVVVFMLLTLPVEFDASRRGMILLRQAGLTTSPQEVAGARQVLTAAALTYVAAFVSALLTLLYYISIAQRRR